MRGYGVASLVLVVLVAITCVLQPCEAQVEWGALVPLLVNKISGLWENDQIELMGHICNYNVNPRFKRWQLHFRGRMWCPGWTNIRGEALTRSRSGVVGKTVTDFVTKAFKADLITEENAKQWINSH